MASTRINVLRARIISITRRRDLWGSGRRRLRRRADRVPDASEMNAYSRAVSWTASWILFGHAWW